MDDLHRLERLVAIMDTLRGPDGCPWDREQDEHSLRRYLLEEAHEAAEAIDLDDAEGLCEELGDLLLQVVFLSRLAAERKRFTIDDVVRSITTKLIRRHPHVFGEERADSAAEVEATWERVKREEKGVADGAPGSALDGVPAAAPAMQRAAGLGAKAARVGFDWPDAGAVLGKVDEELAELREALDGDDRAAVEHELGDTLFALVMLARHAGVDPEAALAGTNRRFAARFGAVERELARDGHRPADVDQATLERAWRAAKAAERGSQTT